MEPDSNARAGRTDVDRRSLLKLAALGLGATVAGVTVPFGRSATTQDWASSLPDRRLPKPWAAALPVSPRLPYREMSDADGPYRLYTVTERVGTAQIIPGLPTRVLGYGFTDLQGREQLSVPGPTIAVPRGTRVKLRVKNGLSPAHPDFGHPALTSTHLHGSASLPQYDGYADDLTAPGQYKDYWYPNTQPARTIWYHDHGVHHTSENVYSGLYAQYHLHDEAEQALLPQGRYDVPLTVTDALFRSDGNLAYADNDFSGLWGDVICVNGAPWPSMPVQRRLYRFRILVTTLSRAFAFSLVDTRTRQRVPVHVVATDGGLVPRSRQVTGWKQGGAERLEVLVDFGAFAQHPGGSTFELRNGEVRNNRDYLHTGKVMRFVLSDEPVTDTRNGTVSQDLVSSVAMGLTRRDAVRERRIELDHDDRTNLFEIDGKTWKDVQEHGHELLAGGSHPAAPGSVELWEVENKSGGWFHPVHFHLVDFQVVARDGGSGRVQEHERGPKDVVHVGEGETVTLLMRYDLAPGARAAAGGRYMIHCHNLVHEDHDMMQQFQVGDTPLVNDPVRADPARPLPVDGVFDDGPERQADRA